MSLTPGGNLSGQGADALAALIKAGAALHWQPTVTVPGAMADDLGGLALQSLADAMGCPVVVGRMAQWHPEDERYTPHVQTGRGKRTTEATLAVVLKRLREALHP